MQKPSTLQSRPDKVSRANIITLVNHLKIHLFLWKKTISQFLYKPTTIRQWLFLKESIIPNKVRFSIVS